MEDAMKIIRDEMQKKDKQIESLKEQLQERDTELKHMKRELEHKTTKIEKKKVKFMHFARSFVNDFNEELQNGKVGGPLARKDESAGQKLQGDETILWESFFDDESSGSDLQQTAKPNNEYGGFVKYSYKCSLPRAARMRAKVTSESSESETDGGPSSRVKQELSDSA